MTNKTKSVSDAGLSQIQNTLPDEPWSTPAKALIQQGLRYHDRLITYTADDLADVARQCTELAAQLRESITGDSRTKRRKRLAANALHAVAERLNERREEDAARTASVQPPSRTKTIIEFGALEEPLPLPVAKPAPTTPPPEIEEKPMVNADPPPAAPPSEPEEIPAVDVVSLPPPHVEPARLPSDGAVTAKLHATGPRSATNPGSVAGTAVIMPLSAREEELVRKYLAFPHHTWSYKDRRNVYDLCYASAAYGRVRRGNSSDRLAQAYDTYERWRATKLLEIGNAPEFGEEQEQLCQQLLGWDAPTMEPDAHNIVDPIERSINGFWMATRLNDTRRRWNAAELEWIGLNGANARPPLNIRLHDRFLRETSAEGAAAGETQVINTVKKDKAPASDAESNPMTARTNARWRDAEEAEPAGPIVSKRSWQKGLLIVLALVCVAGFVAYAANDFLSSLIDAPAPRPVRVARRPVPTPLPAPVVVPTPVLTVPDVAPTPVPPPVVASPEPVAVPPTPPAPQEPVLVITPTPPPAPPPAPVPTVVTRDLRARDVHVHDLRHVHMGQIPSTVLVDHVTCATPPIRRVDGLIDYSHCEWHETRMITPRPNHS